MPAVTVRFQTQAAQNIIRIDDVLLQFDRQGIAVVDLGAGTHVLTWLIRGNSGSTYTLEITSPPGAIMKREATLDHFQLDFGFNEINI